VCGVEKKTAEFPNPMTAAQPNRCRACSKAASAARKIAVAAKVELRRQDIAASRAAVAERKEQARLARLRESASVQSFKHEFLQRMADRKASNDVTAFFQSICTVRCECCYIAPATGQDAIGLRHWCSACGWGIERTGRCLAHPGGELHYPGLPHEEGLTLPPEIAALMYVPPAPIVLEEAPHPHPDDDSVLTPT
jgi:hypothetical protein